MDEPLLVQHLVLKLDDKRGVFGVNHGLCCSDVAQAGSSCL